MGSAVKHFSIQMIDYLAPNSTGLTIEEKQNMFSVINRIEKISHNFPKNKVIDRCFWGQIEDMNKYITVNN